MPHGRESTCSRLSPIKNCGCSTKARGETTAVANWAADFFFMDAVLCIGGCLSILLLPNSLAARVGQDPGTPEGTLGKAATKHANGNEYLSDDFCSHRNASFLSFSPLS